MDTVALTTFVDVMRRGSFAVVARDRGVDPSSISRVISALEDELGVRLFQRTTRRLSPTEAGLRYFERVEPLIDEIEDARLAVVDTGQQPRGLLKVTASVSFGQRCVVPLLPSLAASYPDLIVELKLTDSMVDILAERIDVAIRLGPLADSSLIAVQLLKAKYQVCASPDYLRQHGRPRKPSDIAKHNCLLLPLPGFRKRWIFRDQRGVQTEVPVTGRLLISNASALQQCALAGMGVTSLPHWIVGADIKKGTLVDLFPNHDVTPTDFNTAAWLVHLSRAYVPRKVRVFSDHLRREFRLRPPWLR